MPHPPDPAQFSVAHPPASLSSQVGAVVFGRILVSALDSVRAFAIVRLLTKDDFGTLSLALAWYGTAVTLALVGLPDALLVELPAASAPRRQHIARTAVVLAHALGLVAAMALVGVTYATGLVAADRPDLQLAMWVAAGLIAVDLPGSLLGALLLGTQRHQTAVRLNLGVSFVANVAVLGLAALGAAPQWILAGLGLSSALRLAAVWRYAEMLSTSLRTLLDFSQLRSLLAVSVPLSLNAAAGTLNRQLAVWMAGALLTATAFADFALASQELPFVLMIPNAVMVALLPRMRELAAGDGPNNRLDVLALWHSATLRIALIMLPIFAVCLIEAPTLLALFYENRYASAAPAFRASLFALPLRITTYGTILLAFAAPRPILTSQLVGLVVQVALCALLVVAQRDATLALSRADLSVLAVVAQVVAAWVVVAVMLRAIAALANVSLGQVLPWRGLGLRALLVAVAALPMLAWLALLPAQLPVTLAGRPEPGLALGLLARVASFVATYVALLLAMQMLTAQERATLWTWLRLEPIWRRGR